jgi:uncharacterized protein YqgQ
MLYLADSVSPRKATRLLIERGIFSKEEFLKMVNVVDKEMKKRKRRD